MILPLFDPFPLVHNILFGRTYNTKKYMHILDILNKYTVNSNRLKIVAEDLQEHIEKVPSIRLFDSSNNKTDINTIVHNLNFEIKSNWKKVQNKYWLPIDDNISKFREYIKRSDALELIERKFYQEGGIFQSDTTYNIKVLEKNRCKSRSYKLFFTTDLVYNLNNSSIKDIFGCLIEYYYETKIINQSGDEESLKRFIETIKSLCINRNLKKRCNRCFKNIFK